MWASCLQSEHRDFWLLMAKSPPPLVLRSGTSLQYKSQPEKPTPHVDLQENTKHYGTLLKGTPAPICSASPWRSWTQARLSTDSLQPGGAGGRGSWELPAPPCSRPLCTLLLFQSVHKLLYLALACTSSSQETNLGLTTTTAWLES